MNQRRMTVTGTILVLLGLAFAVLPKDWIERNLGFEPDGGSGALEFLIVLIPVLVGVALLAAAYVRTRHDADGTVGAGSSLG